MHKNLLITGANGQLGREMRAVLENNTVFNSYFTDVDNLDITDAEAVNDFVANNNIDYIVNCAAYTAVDAAEDNIELCTRLNVEAVEILAIVAKKNNVKIIHISTDYVFNGESYRPYHENDITEPKSVYGITKLEGEKRLTSIAIDSIIIRTSWLYSCHGKNYVKTMLTLGKERDALNVVCDQVGTPTSATDLARAITDILNSENWVAGIYHFSNEGAISWYDFTKAIHRIANIDDCVVSPILSSQYPTKATRPFYSVLDKNKIKSAYGITIPYWEDSLVECIKIIEQSGK